MKSRQSPLAPLLRATVLAGIILQAAAARSHELVEFEDDVKPLLTRSCGGAGCHVNEGTSGFEVTTYEKLMASVGVQYGTALVLPGDPAASPLLDKLTQETPRFGDRMPLAADPLSEAEIALISRWILEGAKKSHHLIHGDADGNDVIDISDVITTLLYLFQAGEKPRCDALADADGDGQVSVTDAIVVLSYLFLAGPEMAELTDQETSACQAAGELSFTSIYQKVFAQSCGFSSCHSAASHKADLNLSTREDAHKGLVGVAPTNTQALSGGFLLVDPGKPENSFLLKKLIGPGPGEGNRMPANSSTGLSQATIDAIREWILGGAPLEGTIPGVPDMGDEPPPPHDRIPVPPVPENGIQLHLEPFAIGPGREREIFYYLEKPLAGLAEDPIVQRIDFHMSEESHHFILYEYVGATKPPAGIRQDSLTVDLLNTHHFMAASQQSFFSLAFPDGVGLKFTRDMSFDLNSHYLNLNGVETLYGEVYINLFFAPSGSVTTFAKPIFEIDPFINVPPNKTATTRWNFPGLTSTEADPAIGSGGRLAARTEIYSLSSHMHRHGTRFKIFLIQNGVDVTPPQMVYDNLDWDDPSYKVFNPAMVLKAGQGLRFETTHSYNDPPSPTAPPLTFGPTSEDEMAIMLGYYALK
jgi:hypothetical protein